MRAKSIRMLLSVAVGLGWMLGRTNAWATMPALQAGAKYNLDSFVINVQPTLLPLVVSERQGQIHTGAADLDALNAEIGISGLEPLFPGSRPGEDAWNMAGYYVLKIQLADEAGLEHILNRYAALPCIEHVEPDVLEPVAFTPNDPLYNLGYQWALNQGNDHDLDAPQAWEAQKGSPAAILGIPDTGVLWTHPDLAGNIWTNVAEMNGTTGVDDDGNGYVDDYRGWDWVNQPSGYPGEDYGTPDNDPSDFAGHGTHVAGIAAATTNNGLGVAGIAGGNYPNPGAQIMALRCGWMDASGQTWLSLDYLASAFYYATNKGATALNCSWLSSNAGGIAAATDYAVANGVVVVSAAGNDNSPTAPYLCTRADVIAVAATDQNDVRASFSNYGSWVDVSAPGVAILSTYSNQYNPVYGSMSGTSMACPMVVGIVGLVKSQNPSWNRTQIAPQILSATDPIDNLNPGYAGLLGAGRVNARKALGIVGPVLAVTLTPTGSVTVPSSGGLIPYNIEVHNTVTYPVLFDGWTEFENEQGISQGLVIFRPGLTLGAGGTILRSAVLTVAGSVPNGTYNYYLRVAEFYGAQALYNQTSFQFYKGGADAGAGWVSETKSSGWDDPAAELFVLPETFQVGSAYPNPFNPETTIQFDLPKTAHLNLSIYDLQGRKVVDLLEGTLDAGRYSARWDASDHPSGTYLYRLTSDFGQASGKLMLLK